MSNGINHDEKKLRNLEDRLAMLQPLAQEELEKKILGALTANGPVRTGKADVRPETKNRRRCLIRPCAPLLLAGLGGILLGVSGTLGFLHLFSSPKIEIRESVRIVARETPDTHSDSTVRDQGEPEKKSAANGMDDRPAVSWVVHAEAARFPIFFTWHIQPKKTDVHQQLNLDVLLAEREALAGQSRTVAMTPLPPFQKTREQSYSEISPREYRQMVLKEASLAPL